MHDDVGWTAVFSTWTIDQLGQLGFCRIHDVFDEVNPSHFLLLQYLMQFKRLNGKSLVSFHSLGCNIMIVYSNKQSGSAHLLLKWITKCHLRSADRKEVENSKLNLSKQAQFCCLKLASVLSLLPT